MRLLKEFGTKSDLARGHSMVQNHRSVPLTEAPLEKKLKVVKIAREEDFCSKMAEVGIFPGAAIRIRRVGDHCLAKTTRKDFVKITGKLAKCIIVTY